MVLLSVHNQEVTRARTYKRDSDSMPKTRTPGDSTPRCPMQKSSEVHKHWTSIQCHQPTLCTAIPHRVWNLGYPKPEIPGNPAIFPARKPGLWPPETRVFGAGNWSVSTCWDCAIPAYVEPFVSHLIVSARTQYGKFYLINWARWSIFRAFTLAIRRCEKNPNPNAGFAFSKPKTGFWQRAPGLQTLIYIVISVCNNRYTSQNKYAK